MIIADPLHRWHIDGIGGGVRARAISGLSVPPMGTTPARTAWRHGPAANAAFWGVTIVPEDVRSLCGAAVAHDLPDRPVALTKAANRQDSTLLQKQMSGSTKTAVPACCRFTTSSRNPWWPTSRSNWVNLASHSSAAALMGEGLEPRNPIVERDKPPGELDQDLDIVSVSPFEALDIGRHVANGVAEA